MTDHISPCPPRKASRGRLYVGDARAVLAGMPDQSANCIVTSPPYWGKRDYGVAGQYGHEDSPAAYVDTMRDVFREARRVLADDGTCWLNLGDSYSASGGGATGMHAYLGEHITTHRATGLQREEPARPALAGRVRPAGGRLDSAERDRLAQAQRDARVGPRPAQLPARAAVPARQVARLLVRPRPDPRTAQDRARSASPGPLAGVPARRAARVAVPGRRSTGRVRPRSPRPAGTATAGHRRGHPNGRNPGDVWSIPTRPYNGPHFAAYPIDLPLRCIAAGCKPGGTVLDPFAGSGTTGLAAIQLGRRFTGIDLSPDFARLAAGRLAQAVADKDGGRAMNAATSAEITTRNDIARDIIAGFAAVTPTLAGVFRLIDTALADLPAVLADLGRARAELEAVRLDRANLLAAIRATLAADAEGEPDPLGYLRDELDSTDAPASDEAAGMSTYRQIRRQTRRARRAGLQPIVVIDSPLPVPAAVLLARLAWRYRSEIAPATTAGAVLAAGWWLHHGHAALVAVAARRLRPGRGRAVRIRRAHRPGPARRTGLRGRRRARGGRVARGRRAARPVHLADAASPRRRHAHPRGPVVGAPAPPGHGRECSARSPRGPTSPRRSACPAPRSSPPAWTCGAGGPGSAWPAGRPSPT